MGELMEMYELVCKIDPSSASSIVRKASKFVENDDGTVTIKRPPYSMRKDK